MNKNPAAMLGRLLREGKRPDEAASVVLLAAMGDEILGELEGSVRDWLYGLVLREARHVESREGNRRMKKILGARGMDAGTANFHEAAQKLRRTVYHLPDGARVLWEEMSLDEIEAKIALLRKQVGKLAEHLLVLEAARDLLVERNVSQLGAVPDWPELIRKMTEARKEWLEKVREVVEGGAA